MVRRLRLDCLYFPPLHAKLYTDLLLVGGGFPPVLGAALTASTLPPPSLVTGERRRRIRVCAAKEAGYGEGLEPERSGTSRDEA
jgi:hypothetical protein